MDNCLLLILSSNHSLNKFQQFDLFTSYDLLQTYFVFVGERYIKFCLGNKVFALISVYFEVGLKSGFSHVLNRPYFLIACSSLVTLFVRWSHFFFFPLYLSCLFKCNPKQSTQGSRSEAFQRIRRVQHIQFKGVLSTINLNFWRHIFEVI